MITSWPSEFLVRIMPEGSALTIEVTYADGSIGHAAGFRSRDFILWIDLNGNLFLGNICDARGSMSGVVFGGRGGWAVWRGEEL